MNILHYGWLGCQNFGDDIMAAAIYSSLRQSGKVNSIYTSSPLPPPSFLKSRWTKPAFLKRFFEKYYNSYYTKSSDIFIIGGGSILHTEQSIDWKIQAIKQFKNRPHKKVLGLNLSVGPFDSSDAETKCYEFFSLLDGATLRDVQSWNFVTSGKNYDYRPLLAGDLAGVYFKDLELSTGSQSSPVVGINFSAALQNPYDIYKPFFQEVVKSGSKIRVFNLSVFDRYNDKLKAETALTEFGIPLNQIEFVDYSDDLNKFITKMRECCFFAGERLHSLICAYLCNLPFISLTSKSKKVIDLLETVGATEAMNYNPCEFCLNMNNTQIYKAKLPVTEYIDRSMINLELINNFL